VQKSYTTTLPRRSFGVSGGELIQPFAAASAGTDCAFTDRSPAPPRSFGSTLVATNTDAPAMTATATKGIRYRRRVMASLSLADGEVLRRGGLSRLPALGPSDNGIAGAFIVDLDRIAPPALTPHARRRLRRSGGGTPSPGAGGSCREHRR